MPTAVFSDVPERLPEQVELALYFVACEALANVAKYAEATTASMRLCARAKRSRHRDRRRWHRRGRPGGRHGAARSRGSRRGTRREPARHQPARRGNRRHCGAPIRVVVADDLLCWVDVASVLRHLRRHEGDLGHWRAPRADGRCRGVSRTTSLKWRTRKDAAAVQEAVGRRLVGHGDTDKPPARLDTKAQGASWVRSGAGAWVMCRAWTRARAGTSGAHLIPSRFEGGGRGSCSMRRAGALRKLGRFSALSTQPHCATASSSSAAASAACRRPAPAPGAGRRHADRPAQLPPLPAAALPGGRPARCRRGRDRRAAARVFRPPAQRPRRLGEVTGVDLERRRVLIDAAGRPRRCDPVRHADRGRRLAQLYFGHDEWTPFAPGIKTLEDALDIRARISRAFEAAELEHDAERRAAWLTLWSSARGRPASRSPARSPRSRTRRAARLPGDRSARSARPARRRRRARARDVPASLSAQGRTALSGSASAAPRPRWSASTTKA